MVLICSFPVELPGIEPVSGCWPLSQTGTELRNDIDCDSPELTSVDSECAQNVPSESLDRQRAIALARALNNARHAMFPASKINQRHRL
jgi:hypothetical protein